VRQTLFDWLGHDLSGWRCLDVFAGSGALGFEAASRGAASVVLVERDAAAAESLRASRLRLQAEQIQIVAGDALAWMARCAAGSFELAFVDPPFDSNLLGPAAAAASRLLVDSGLLYLESGTALLPDLWAPLGLTAHRQGRAGAVHFQLLRRTRGA
jgi:16S rRNA (guanine(966)-N(2))-methyltransferase RsmD